MASFYLDENVSGHTLPEFVARGHDPLHARTVLAEGTSDHLQLATAVGAGRILVTHNRDDFWLLHRAWRGWPGEWGTTSAPRHAGILILPQPPILDPAQMVEEIDKLLADVGGPDALANRLFRWLPGEGWVELS